jgi:hypothetical protein
MKTLNRNGLGNIAYVDLTAGTLPQEQDSWLTQAQAFVGQPGDRDTLWAMHALACRIQASIRDARVCTIDHALALVQVQVMLANARRLIDCETDEDTMVLAAATQFNRGNRNIV